jgi:hypothetical protein
MCGFNDQSNLQIYFAIALGKNQGNRKVQLKNLGLHSISILRLTKRLKSAPRNVLVAGGLSEKFTSELG